MTWVNDRRAHSGVRQSKRRLRHHSATCWSPTGRSRIRTSERSLNPGARLTALRADPLVLNGFNDDLDHSVGDTDDVDDTEAVQAEQQRRSVVHARGLAAVGCGRQTACRGHEPHSRIDTPRKCGEPLKEVTNAMPRLWQGGNQEFESLGPPAEM